MKTLLRSLLFAAFVLVTTGAQAIFPDQPHIEKAYNKVSATLKVLEDASRGGKWDKAVQSALSKLGEARVELDMARKDKGSARGAAIDLIDQATQKLSANPVTKAELDKSIEICKEALEKIIRAGKAGR